MEEIQILSEVESWPTRKDPQEKFDEKIVTCLNSSKNLTQQLNADFIPKSNALSLAINALQPDLPAILGAAGYAALALENKDKAEIQALKANAEARAAALEANKAKAEADRAKLEADRAKDIVGIDLASVDKAGIVKPDGVSIAIDKTGTISSRGGAVVVSEVSITGSSTPAIGYETPYTFAATTGLQPGQIASFRYKLDAEAEPVEEEQLEEQLVVATNNSATINIIIPENTEIGTVFILTVTAIDSFGNTRASSKMLSAGAASVAPARILSPLPEDIVYNSGFIVVLGEFSTIGADDRHVESEYRVARDALGLDIVLEYTGTDLLSHSFSDVTLAEGNYYIRARQRGEVLGWGEWSVGVGVEIKKTEDFFISTGDNSAQNTESIFVDSKDNTYLAGTTNDITPNTGKLCILVVKFDSDGNRVWDRKIYSSNGYSTVIISSSKKDTQYVYLLAQVTPTTELALIKLDSDGNIIWARSIKTTDNKLLVLSSGNCMCFTSDGIIFISGAVDHKTVLLIFNSSGGLLSSKICKVGHHLAGAGTIWGICTDNIDNLYLVAGLDNTITAKIDIISFRAIWCVSDYLVSNVRTITTDASHAVYTAGSGGAICKYNSSGLPVWRMELSRPSEFIGAHPVTIDGTGNVYAINTSRDLVKLTNSGEFVWNKTIGKVVGASASLHLKDVTSKDDKLYIGIYGNIGMDTVRNLNYAKVSNDLPLGMYENILIEDKIITPSLTFPSPESSKSITIEIYNDFPTLQTYQLTLTVETPDYPVKRYLRTANAILQ